MTQSEGDPCRPLWPVHKVRVSPFHSARYGCEKLFIATVPGMALVAGCQALGFPLLALVFACAVPMLANARDSVQVTPQGLQIRWLLLTLHVATNKSRPVVAKWDAQ